MAKPKYEVVPYNTGGYFIHGSDMLSENYFKNQADADKACQALNIVERFCQRSITRSIDVLIDELELLKKELS